jgi:hypothetical protein
MWDPVTTAWRILGLRIEETTSNIKRSWEYTELSSRGQQTRGDLPAWVLSEGLTTPHHKVNSLLGNVTEDLRIGGLLWTR